MESLLIVIAAGIGVTVLCEGILWMIFRQKLSPLVFPHELDTSYFRFFSLRRLRITALAHAIGTAVCIVILCLYLW